MIQGRYLNEYAEVKMLLASLMRKATDMGVVLERIAHQIKPSGVAGASQEPFSGKVPDLSSFPGREQLSDLLTEIAQARDNKRALQRQLKEYGVEVKD